MSSEHPPSHDASANGADPDAAASPDALAEGLPALAPDIIEEVRADDIDNVVPTYGYHQMPVVGLGGSAGSIQALKSFFQALPPDTGMAYAVILHLSPEHDSILPSVLQAITRMAVSAAKDGEKLEPNHVYVIPPGKHLIVINGHLRLSALEPEHGKRVAVDLFFRSLADTHGPHASAIVLSGADSDGAIGIKRIKERGGLTIAQDPEEAEHTGMPRAAIATGMVDWVLPVADMPRRILRYRAAESELRLPAEDGPQPAQPVVPPADPDEVALRDVLVFLRTRTGRDFSYYKRATIVRRISRRMQINTITDLPGYLAFLRLHPGEAGALLQDLLISVTNFFRDRDAFGAVEHEIARLFDGKRPEDTVRVWTAACATGEETYSMAMLLLEHARTLDNPPAVQVFGCDLDNEAIQQARAGLYPLAIAADVSDERLAHFFVKEHGGYRVKRELREMVLFAEHDLLKDAPFSRMDLISCRNLLIYLNRDAQRRALEIFHFALQPGGRLFLGSSETVDEDSELFTPLDKKHRLYVRRAAPRVGLPVPIGTGTLMRSLLAQSKDDPAIPSPVFTRHTGPPFTTGPTAAEERAGLAGLHLRLIERHAPPSLVVNDRQDIVHLSGNVGRFLQPADGQLTMNLLHTVNPALRINLRAALFRVAETDVPVDAPGIAVTLEGTPRLVDLRVAPAGELAPGYLLVTFGTREPDAALAVAPTTTGTEAVMRHLEREVEETRGQLRDTVERYEANTEELKASNEELQAMNEELRSATEELETSREELQSINEELNSVNLEMKENVEELAHANSDLQNLMASTSIATVFLDRDLRVMRYTPQAVTLFNLIHSDVGRPLADLSARVDYPDLLNDVETVLRDLAPIERQVRGDRKWFLARLRPYRSQDDRIKGVVLTFVDITERTESEQRFAALVTASSEAVYRMSPDWSEMRHLSGGGFLPDSAPANRNWIEDYVPPDEQERVLSAVNEAVRAKSVFELEHRVRRADGSVGWTLSRAVPILSPAGGIQEWFGSASDVTKRKQDETTLRENEEKYRMLFETMTEGMAVYELIRDGTGQAVDFRWLLCNSALERLLGRPRAELIGHPISEFLPPHEREEWLRICARVAETNVTINFEHGSVSLAPCWDLTAFPYGGDRFGVLYSDVTEQKRRERNLAFLANVGANLSHASSQEEIVRSIGLELGAFLDVPMVYVMHIDETRDEARFTAIGRKDNAPDMPEVIRVSDFVIDGFYRAARAGEIAVVRDTETDPRTFAAAFRAIDLRAALGVPFNRDGELKFMLVVADSCPRDWRDDEIELFRELSSRLFPRLERARAEEALRESEERLQAIADLVPDLLWSSDPGAHTTWYNQRWLDYTGQSMEEARRRGWLAVIHPDEREGSRQHFEQAVQTGDTLQQELRIRRADGAYRCFLVRAESLRNEHGEVIRWFGSATDIDDIQHARAEAETASKAKDHFLAVLSHELRTPLTPITMALHTLRRRADLPEPVRQAHEMIARNVQLESHFIDDLLDITRLSHGKMEIAREDMDLHEALRGALEISSPDMAAKRQPLTVTLAAAQHRVSGDPARLQQVFWNLLKNASKFTPEGGAIRVESRNEPGHVVVEVTDSGIGLEPDAVTRIFNPFEQADRSITRKFGGLGLGLAIAKATINSHAGGTLEASSPGQGKGATFSVRLPLVDDA